MSPEELARQGRQHLESLRAAGVEWAPAPHTAPPPAPPPPAAVAAPELVASASLFADLAASAEGEPGRPEQTLEHRRHALELLAEQVSTCSRCPQLMSTRTQTVFGHGPIGAEL